MPKPAPLRMTLLGLKSDAVEHVLAEQALVQEEELRMLRDLVVAERNQHEHLRSRIAWAEQQLQQAELLANQGLLASTPNPALRATTRVGAYTGGMPAQGVTPESAEQQLARMRKALVDMLGDMKTSPAPPAPTHVPGPTHMPTSAYVQTTHVHTTHVQTSAHVHTPGPAAPFQEPARFSQMAAPYQEPPRFNQMATPFPEAARQEPVRPSQTAAPVQEPTRFNSIVTPAHTSLPSAEAAGKTLVDLNGQKLVSPFQLSANKPAEPANTAEPVRAAEPARPVEPSRPTPTAMPATAESPVQPAGDLATTFAAPKPSPAAAAQVRSQINAAMLRILSGKMVGQDLLDEAGNLVAARGTLITAELATKAEAAGVLPDLVLHMVWPEGTDA